MREITYSQGLTIGDPALLTTLSIFCGKVWLPYERVGDAMQEVLTEARPDISKAIRNDPARVRVEQWESQYSDLFDEGVLERLPGPQQGPHEHRHDFDDRSIKEILGEEKSIYERLALRFHFTRGGIPGIELFNAGTPKSEVDLATSLFHLDLPKIDANPNDILELREEAQSAGVQQFWQMIEEQAAYAEAQNQPALARAEKIRDEFAAWNKDRLRLRGTTLGLTLLVTLAGYWWDPLVGWTAAATGLIAGAATSVIPTWLGDLNARWAAENMKTHRAFKCISCVDRKLNNLNQR